MKSIFLMVAAVTISAQLQAQTGAGRQPADSTKNLDEVIITATKTELKQSQTGKVVSVIDQATLQRNAGKTLTEILNYQAGVFIIGANNSPGSNQDIYLRGASTGNVLILLDGVPVNDASYINNSFDLNTIAPSQIERIEILKGAQSTLWGSDAVAGVINIITRKAGAKKAGITAGVAYGSYNTARANAGIDGTAGKLSYQLQYNHTNSKGFSSAQDSTGIAGYDKDGFTQNNVQARVGYQFSPGFSASLFSSYGNYHNDLDGGAFSDDKDYKAKNINVLNSLVLQYKWKTGALHFTNTLMNAKRTSLNDTTAAFNNGELYGASFKGTTLVNELYGNFNLTKKLSLVAGVQRLGLNTAQEDSGYSRSYMFGYASKLGKDSTKAHNISVYASAMLLDVKGFNVEAGFRYNNHSIYGNNTTFTFNPSYNIDADTRVFINVSSGYKIPSLYQLYSEYGNRKLQPEKTNNYEAGVQTFSNNKKNSFRIVAFKRDIKNVIVFYTDPVTYASQYINRDQQNDYGFEIESNIAIGKIGNWVSNFTYIDGEGVNNNVKVNNLYRRPNFSMNSTLTLQPVKGLTISPSFRFVGNRLKGLYDAGPNQMPKYYTLDFYTAYQCSKNVNLYVDLRNITDQNYADVVGYNSRRFNCMAGINVHF